MTALYIAPRVPVVDPQTGICVPIWYRFFMSFANTAGPGAVDDFDASEVAPALSSLLGGGGSSSHVDADVAPSAQQFISIADNLAPVPQPYPGAADDVAPHQQQYFIAADDVMPVIYGLQAQIAMLQTQINDIRQGVPSL